MHKTSQPAKESHATDRISLFWVDKPQLKITKPNNFENLMFFCECHEVSHSKNKNTAATTTLLLLVPQIGNFL